MARDPLSDAWAPDESNTNSKLLDYVQTGVVLTGGAAMARQVGKHAFANFTDTQGFGGLGGDPRYRNTGKFAQAWSNFLQANAGQKGNVLTKPVRVMGKIMKGGDLEILAAEESIREIKNELKNPTLNKKEVATLKNELKNRIRDLEDRKVTVHNKYKQLGLKPPTAFEMDFAKPGMTKVTPLMAKVEKGLAPFVGQQVPATFFSKVKMSKFKEYAAADPRVNYVSKLMESGKIHSAKKAAEGGHYVWKKELVKPALNVDGIPVHPSGKIIGGMKLELLPRAEWYVENGRKVRTYGLGFAPLDQRLNKRMDYIAGRHYQRMHFIPHGNGYRKVALEVIDQHNYAWNKPMEFLERRILGAKPVVNTGYTTYNMPQKKGAHTKPRKQEFNKRIYPAARKEFQTYSFTKTVNKKATKSLLESALRIVGKLR